MARSAPTSIADHFRRLPDPRVRRTCRHALVDILVITLCAVICGADDWVAIARFGRAKRKWFREFLTLRHGIASHDTFGRVFAAMDPDAFRGLPHTTAETVDGDHGRIEVRRAWATDDLAW